MRTSVERLRIGLVVGAGLLVLVIAAFLGYARYKVHRALVDLPGRLGATITKEFNGYTYSQSDGGKTIFTIHAAKAVQHTDGTYMLHDVNMILYGKRGDRADRISGDDFEYDTKDEVIRALGIVHLDLEAPMAEGARTSEAAKHLDGGSAGHEDAGEGSRVIHVKTSGLVYMKKLGVAATAQGIEFAFGGFIGHAVGAEYDSDTGHLLLQSAITVSGLEGNHKGGGHPMAMTASHGELDRGSEIAEFADAHYSSAGETAQAEMAKIHLRHDGTVERIEGERRVVLEAAGQGSVRSDRADVALNTTSKPKTAVLTGSVHFEEDEALRQARGDSERANLDFDGQGHIQHAVLQGNVRTSEVLRGAGAGTGAPSRRDLTADNLELSMVSEGEAGRPQLRDAKASGSARLSSFVPDAKSGGATSTKLAGDSLLAHFVSQVEAGKGIAELSSVRGAGSTTVEQVTAQGVDQTSSGETLDAEFRPSAKGKGAVELATVVQQGGVVMNRRVPAKKVAGPGAAPDVQHATAAKAVFDTDTDRLTLTGDLKTGDVRMSDATSEISAARVVLEQDSGDATADGAVKVNYLQAGSGSRTGSRTGSGTGEPVHVLAARAELKHDAGRATFYGRSSDGRSSGAGSAGVARMWQAGAGGQGGSQVEAPVLVFEQEEKRLTARAETAGTPGTVHAVLADAASAKRPAAAAKAGAKDAMQPLRQGVARITSSLMVYSDLKRQAEFTGGVTVEDATGEMRAQQATVFLAAAGSGKGSNAGSGSVPGSAVALTGLFGGSVERIVATQRVEITQPGRKATGERLVYTASDQMFVLTGTAASPPKVVDATGGSTGGTTTGAALRFHSGDDSVIVSGNDGDTPAQKVRTETRVKQK